MGNRGLLNLALLACVIVLGLIIYFKPGLEHSAVPQPLTQQLAAEDATGIRIERLTREPLSFSKHDNHWVLAGDTPLPAAEFQVRALLDVLQTSILSRYPADGLDLAELGLQPPQASVLINDFKIRVGITDAMEKSRYLQIGDTVFLVRDQYQHLLNADWSNFVERKLLPAGLTLTRLQLPGLQLVQGDRGEWQMSPEMPGISADTIQQLLQHWTTATALYVRRYDGKRTDERVHIEAGADNTALDFMVTAHEPELVLARPEIGIQYHLTRNMDDILLNLRETSAEP